MNTPANGPNSQSRVRSQRVSRREIASALVSLVSFLCFLVSSSLLLWKADQVAARGLTFEFYYFALVTLALVPSSLLFGFLPRSEANYSGHHFGGALKLAGAPVVFFLVIVLGVVLRSTFNFPLTVYVHGPAGPQNLILKSSGYVLLDLGGDRRRELVGEKGQAIFSEIPSNFRGKEVRLFIDAVGYELTDPENKYVLNGESIYLQVKRKAGHMVGRVKQGDGTPLADVTISVGDLTAATDSLGHFNITIPGDQLQNEMPLTATKRGYLGWNGKAVPDSHEFVITLRREHSTK
jgi:hypothetical protein